MIRGDNHLVLDNMRDDIPDIVQWTREHGRPVKPRSKLTYELRNMAITLLDPVDSLPIGVSEKITTFAEAAVEALQLISGTHDFRLANRITEGIALSPGPAIRTQLGTASLALLSDGQTRQSIVLVNDPASPSPPCLLSLQFFWRDGKLELHTNMRSESVMRIGTDLFSFAQLQITMARFLNTETGPLQHHVGSLHLYGSDIGMLDHLHNTTELTRPTDLPTGFGDSSESVWQQVADRARFVLDVGSGRITEGVNRNAFSPSEKWYLEQIRPYWVSGG